MSAVYNYSGVTSKTQIATILSKDKPLITEIKRTLQYKEYSEDIIQDIILQILETKKEDKLIEICQRNEFKYWLFHVVTVKRTKNKYININELITYDFRFETNEYTIKEEQEHKKYVVSIIKEELGKLHWYKQRIFQEYITTKEQYEKEGKKFSFRELENKVNIKEKSLWALINTVKNKIKQRINGVI